MPANPLSYPQANAAFSKDVFRNPTAEYRGAPFWSWNTKLDLKKILPQIEYFQEMGMGGFHIHSRVGLDTEYMGEEFLAIARACVERAEEKKMLACLYDEDRWPSGVAGGLVLKDNPQFRGRHILLTPWPYGKAPPPPAVMNKRATAIAFRSELGELLARYDVSLDENGKLASCKRLEDTEDGENVWFAYSEPNPPSEFFNDDTYVDTLNKAATKRFTETTHDVYKTSVGDKFGTVVPCIFTDEPQFAHKVQLSRATAKQDVFLPWTSDFLETFRGAYGYEFLDRLPEVAWDLPNDEPSQARYHFHDHVCERFVDAFMDFLADWCRENGIYLTGHMMKEPKLSLQTESLGEAMRCYRKLDMPGIDILCDHREFTTAKQAQSVARQNGARGVMSEEYGVTNWTFTFEGHKGQGDWQAALGITLRVHHLSWVSMAGEAKRDFPAAIGYQSPWYREYKFIEDHFSRVNVALTRGRPGCRVAVIHPIESYWLCAGPNDQNHDEMQFREKAFLDLPDWLLLGHIDFDFISESLFPTQTSEGQITGLKLPVGKCQYEAVVVPNLKTIRSTTLSRLRKFAKAGGTVLIAGTPPTLVDATVPGESPDIQGAKHVFWSKQHVQAALSPFRDVSIVISESTLYAKAGSRADSLIYQRRIDGEDEYLFICNVDRKQPRPSEISVRGRWAVQVLDTLTGEEWELRASHRKGWTVFNYHFDGCASLLLRLTPGTSSASAKEQFILRTSFKTAGEVKLEHVELSEPNVLLLDRPEYSWNHEPFNSAEEILRIDNIIRTKRGLPLKAAAFRQPWSIPEKDRRTRHGTLRLKYRIFSEIPIETSQLALENAESTGITVDGVKIASAVTGWWVDKDISTVALPSMARGEHTIELEYGYNILTNLERIYVLGSFGVEVRGRTPTVLPLDLARVQFGDYTSQRLPFYAGNVTYNCTFDSPRGGRTALEVSRFSAPTISVALDGQPAGNIAFEPHVLDLGELSAGEHRLSITSFGNRENSFGPIHLPDGCTDWIGPNAFRTEHEWWTDEYNLVKMGVLETPRIKEPGRDVVKILRRGFENVEF